MIPVTTWQDLCCQALPWGPHGEYCAYNEQRCAVRLSDMTFSAACLPTLPCAGLWLFSRKPVDPTNTATMRTKAQQLGFDVSVLKKVQQQGCTYPATVAPTDTANIVSALPFFRG
jgi:hypothetical protein